MNITLKRGLVIGAASFGILAMGGTAFASSHLPVKAAGATAPAVATAQHSTTSRPNTVIPPITTVIPPITTVVRPVTTVISPITTVIPPVTTVRPVTTVVPPITTVIAPITSVVPISGITASEIAADEIGFQGASSAKLPRADARPAPVSIDQQFDPSS